MVALAANWTRNDFHLSRSLGLKLVLLNFAAIFVASALTIIAVGYLHGAEQMAFARSLSRAFGLWGFVILEVVRFALVWGLFELPRITRISSWSKWHEHNAAFYAILFLFGAFVINGIDAAYDALVTTGIINAPIPLALLEASVAAMAFLAALGALLLYRNGLAAQTRTQ